MKTKKFDHNKIEKCRISKKDINTESESYSVVLDCDGEVIRCTGFYKSEELKNLIKGNTEKVTQNLLNKQAKLVKGMLGSNPMFREMFGKKEVYKID